MARQNSRSVILTKLLNYLSVRQASSQGFVLPLVIGLGLIMTVAGLTMVVRSSDNQVSAEQKQQNAKATQAAEAGISQFSSYLNNPQNAGLLPTPYEYTNAFNLVWESADDNSDKDSGNTTNVSSACIQLYLESLDKEDGDNRSAASRIFLSKELENNTRYDIVRYIPPFPNDNDSRQGLFTEDSDPKTGQGELVVLGRYNPNGNFEDINADNRLNDLPNKTATSLIQVDIEVDGTNFNNAQFEAPFPVGFFNFTTLDNSNLEAPDGVTGDFGLICAECDNQPKKEERNFDLQSDCQTDPNASDFGGLTGSGEGNLLGSKDTSGIEALSLLGNLSVPDMPEVKQTDFDDNSDSNFDSDDKNDLKGKDIGGEINIGGSDNTYTNSDGQDEYHYRVTVSQLEDKSLSITGENDNPIYIHVDGDLNKPVNIDTNSLNSGQEDIRFIFNGNLGKNASPSIDTSNGAPVSLFVKGNIDISGGSGVSHNGDFGDLRIFGHPDYPESTEEFRQDFTLRGSSGQDAFIHAPNAQIFNKGNNPYQGIVWADEYGEVDGGGGSSATKAAIKAPNLNETELRNRVDAIYGGATNITLSIDLPNMGGNNNFQQTSIEQQN